MSAHDVWYLTRSSGLVAFGLAWFAVVLGLFASLQLTRPWPGPATAIDLHEHASLLSIGFAALHAVVLIADPGLGSHALALLIPFLPSTHGTAIELGKLGFWLLVLITLSFHVRRRIGVRAWRVVHYSSFVVYLLALVHALVAGTDTGSPSGVAFYGLTTATVIVLTLLRVRASRRVGSPIA